MRRLSLLLSAVLLLAALPVAGGFAADSEDYVGGGSHSPEYHLEEGQLTPVSGADHADAHAQDHGADHHDEGGLPQLDFSTWPSQIFWLFIAFTALYFIFSKKTLPEISSTIENRREQVDGDLDGAERLKAEAEEVHSAYEEILAEARQKASNEFVKTEEKIKKSTAQKLEKFKDSSSEKLVATEKEVDAAKQAALVDMHAIAAEVASEAAKKIVGVSTDIDQAKTLVKNIDRKAA